MTKRWSIVGLVVCVATTACIGDGNDGFGEPLILPSEAKLGATVGMAINSNYMPFGLGEYYSLTSDTVTLQVLEEGGSTVIDTVSSGDLIAVFDAGPTHAPVLDTGGGASAKVGAALTIILFKLPTTIPGTFPRNVDLRLKVAGVSEAATDFIKNTITITGTGGSEIAFNMNSDPTVMEPPPMVRLVGRLGSPGFTNGGSTVVAGIEFTIQYDPLVVANPRAVPVTGATYGTVLVGTPVAQGGLETARVVIVNPNGMPEGDLAQGPFLDIVFDKLQPFDESAVTILDLKLFDRDGNTPFGANPDPADYINKIARKSS
jgi:hypothetical protein